MSVYSFKLRLFHLKQDMKSVWKNFRKDIIDEKKAQNHVMTQEEQLDETIKESFPASDPPGHFSKSREDKELH